MQTLTKKELKQKARELVLAIRNYSRSQAALWQRVPYLALQADGRNGYSDDYSRAYHYGYWALYASKDSSGYTIYVDLATGELVSPWSPEKSVSDAKVLTLAADVDELDVPAIIDFLEKEARKPVGSYYDPEKQTVWRRGLLEELKLKPLYMRTRHFPARISIMD